jgi:hypothetical protein
VVRKTRVLDVSFQLSALSYQLLAHRTRVGTVWFPIKDRPDPVFALGQMLG